MSLSSATSEEMGPRCWLGLGLQAFEHYIFWQGFLPLDSWLVGCVGVISLSVLLVSVSPVAGSGDFLVHPGTWQLPNPAEPQLSWP